MPPTSAWCARVTAKPSSVRDTSVMSGRCVPPVNGSLRIQTSPGLRVALRCTAATASGIAPRCTGMCSAWATIRPVAVEERRRAVAPLLDVGREGGADQRRAHLLGDRAQRAADHLELDVHARVRARSVPVASVVPRPPVGHPAGGARRARPPPGPSTRERRRPRERDARRRARPRPCARRRARAARSRSA